MRWLGWWCSGPAFVWLVVLGTAACAPKRVSRVTASAPAAATETIAQAPRTLPPREPLLKDVPRELPADPLPDPLPEPLFRGKSGLAATRTTPDNLKLGLQAATLARQQLGKAYQWGASGPDRFDCSGLVQFVYGNLGVPLPRVSHSQAQMGQSIARSDLQPGDLLFFAVQGSRIDHVGIFIGNQSFVHASRKQLPVRTDSLNNSWWRNRFRLARRLE